MRKSQVKKTKKWREIKKKLIKKSTVYRLREFSTVLGKITDKKIENSQIVKALNVLLNNFYRNKDELKTTLYPKPNLIDNGYNSRRIKIVTTIYNVLNARQSDSDKEE